MTGSRGWSHSIWTFVNPTFDDSAEAFVYCRFSSAIAIDLTPLLREPHTPGRPVWACLLLVGAAFLVAYLVYRYRVRRIESELTRLFHKRLAERASLAIDLNDSLLQTIEATKLIADDALNPAADLARTRSSIGRLSYWLGTAIVEGQASLNSLRNTDYDGNDLAQAFLRALEECLLHRPLDFTVNITGVSRDVNPTVRDDFYLLGCEVLSLLCNRDGVNRLEVTLQYGTALCLQIRSKRQTLGSDVVHTGESTPFDLCELQKRARRFGATIYLTNSSNSTLVITLTVPGNIAFINATAVLPPWLHGLLNRLRIRRGNRY